MLQFDAVSKRFGGCVALDRCSFAARPGRLTGFLGPNGAGKTTAMRAVIGLVQLDTGVVRWQALRPCRLINRTTEPCASVACRPSDITAWAIAHRP